MRKIAKRRTPETAFDYTDGTTEDESSLRRARRAFQGIEFHLDILYPAGDIDTSCEAFGGPSSIPFSIVLTGFTWLMQAEDEIAGTDVTGAVDIPFTLSALRATSIEGAKTANPCDKNWFQFYVMHKREIFYAFVECAKKAGLDTLIFIADTPVAGTRLRDKRNGFSIPPQITLKTIFGAIPRLWRWFDFLTTPKLEFTFPKSTDGIVEELLDSVMNPIASHDNLAVIRSMWDGRVVVEGA